MRLEQLQAFLAIAETGSFQQAAQRCGVTQSTISRQIQALESTLNLSLLHRAHQTRLTIGGERLLPRARKICQEWQHLVQEIADLQAGRQPELCVAAIHSICPHLLPPVLAKFCQNYPEVQLRITALGSDRALKVLKDGLVDLAIVMNNPFLTASPDMVVQVLFDEPVRLLMAATHPLSSQERVSWPALAAYPQVVFKDGYGMQRLVQEQFTRRGIPLQAALELNTPDAFLGVVRQGQMLALLPESALVDAYTDPTLAVREVISGQGSLAPRISPRLANGHLPPTNLPHGKPPGVTLPEADLNDPPLTRQVVMVTSRDRLEIPPIRHFYELVRELLPLGANLEKTPAAL